MATTRRPMSPSAEIDARALSLIATVVNEIIAHGGRFTPPPISRMRWSDSIDNDALRPPFCRCHGWSPSLNQAVGTAQGPVGKIIAWVYRLIARSRRRPITIPTFPTCRHKTFAPTALLAALAIRAQPVPAAHRREQRDPRPASGQYPRCAARSSRDADNDLGQLSRHDVAKWFDSAMDRVSGRYNRQLKRISLFVGLILVLVVNADTVDVARSLWTNSALRLEMVQVAGRLSQGNPDRAPSAAAPPAPRNGRRRPGRCPQVRSGNSDDLPTTPRSFGNFRWAGAPGR